MKRTILFLTILFFSISISAKQSLSYDFCVAPNGSGETGLQGALDIAKTNNQNDLVKVVQGTYTGNFSYNSSQGYSITLEGGYTSGCAARIMNPSNTILDGNHASRVLYLYNSNGGNISVEGFTLQNGNSSGSGGGIYAESYCTSGTSGSVTINKNIIQDSTASYSGGGIFASSSIDHGTGNSVLITNNVITGNSASLYDGGGVSADSYTTDGILGSIILVNNIIAGNTSTSRGGWSLHLFVFRISIRRCCYPYQ